MADTLPLTFMLIGGPKQGKTWLSSTVPAPRLIIDLEGRARYTPNGEKASFWNGVDDPMKINPKSPSSTYILETTDIQVLDTARQWLRTGKHPFKSIVLDSVMELRYYIIQSFFPGAIEIPRQQWGKPNNSLEQALRDLKHMVLSKDNPCKCMVFVTGATTDIESGKVKPLVKGTVGELAVYWMDVVGYLHYDPKTMKRYLYIGPNPMEAEVGDGTNRIITKLGGKIVDPDFEVVFNALQES